MDEFEAAEMIVKTQCDGLDVRAIRWTSTYVSDGGGNMLMLCYATADTLTAPILTAWVWRTMEELERVGIPTIVKSLIMNTVRGFDRLREDIYGIESWQK